MKYNKSLIQKSTTKLVAFNGIQSMVIQKIVMPITLQKKTVLYTMMVIDNDFAYNTILGRSWIQMDIVTSSLHQMLKFSKKDVIEVVKGDQKTARTCYMDTVKNTPKSSMTK